MTDGPGLSILAFDRRFSQLRNIELSVIMWSCFCLFSSRYTLIVNSDASILMDGGDFVRLKQFIII